jgi:cytochrome c oxidase assembly factor CtaG
LSFGAGLAVVAVALASPLDARADTSLTAHMIQHVLLLTLAGPLLALGRPIPTLLWCLPAEDRAIATRAYRRLLRAHGRRYPQWVAATLIVEATVMWGWHLPDLYQAALRHPALHAAEHASFLAAATAAWWSVANGPRAQRGGAAIAALIGSVPGIGLGSALVLAPNPWYPIYTTTTRASALADQQLAGVIMWAFGGMAAVIAGAGLFASWLRTAPSEPDPARLGALTPAFGPDTR